MSDQAVLKCRWCDVDAEISPLEGDLEMVSCPSCGRELTGERLHRMVREQKQYLFDKIDYDDFNARGRPSKTRVVSTLTCTRRLR